MKSKDFFLLFIFGLFLFLLPSLAEGACRLWCTDRFYDTGAARCFWGRVDQWCFVDYGVDGDERIGTLDGKVTELSGSDCPCLDCVQNCSGCKQDGFPSGSNGESCTARDRALSGLSCNNCFKSGKWDYSGSQCVECSGKIENRILGNTSSVGDVCNDNFPAGDGQCESGCGASPECDEKTYGAAVSVSGGECRYCVFYPAGCTIGGTPYADGKCNGKCQYCDISKSTTAWSNVPSGKVCNSNSLINVSSTYYCNYGEDCDTGDCSATKWWTSCNGSGSCRAAGSSPPTGSYSETVTADDSKVLKNDCSQTSPSTSYYCGTPAGICNTTSTCDGSMLYKGCYSKSCSNSASYGYTDTTDDSACDDETCSTTDYCNGSCAWYTGKTCLDGNCTQGYGGGDCGSYTCSGGSCTTTCSTSCGAACASNADCPTGSTCQANCTCSGVPEFDFSISLDPSSGSVTQGDAINTTVNLGLTSGTSQTVTLSASDLPPGASYAFYSDGSQSNSCSPPCSRRLAIFTTADTPVGNYPNIKVTGTGGGKTHDAFYNLTVTAAEVTINPPSVITNTATNVTQASATLNGTLSNMGNAPTCYVWFEYWVKPGADCTPKPANPTVATPDSPFMASPGSFSKSISGLTSNTNYCFEAYAKNGGSW